MTLVRKILAHYPGRTTILLDTNLLVLLLVGYCDPDFVEQCKQTKRYSRADFLTLQHLVVGFQQLTTTPHILAETSNLLEGLTYRTVNLLDILANFVENVSVVELGISVTDMTRADRKCLTKFGVTDTGIRVIAAESTFVLTDDLDLCAYLQNRNVAALNFQNLRQL